MKPLFQMMIMLIIANCYAQKNFLDGKWKVIAVHTGDLYVNAKTDSISSAKFQIPEMDSVQKKVYIKNAGNLYLDNTFVFDENGEFTEISQFFKLTLKYVLNETTKTIVIYNGSETDNDIAFKMPYEYEDNLLYLSVKHSDSEIKYTLERLSE